jgi:fructose-bisphosphate aldolase class II
MDDLLIQARKENIALGAFECWDSASIQGICMAAKRCNSPVIFQATPLEYSLIGGADALSNAVNFYVKKYDITAALHLDHGSTLEQVEDCLKSGFTSVMLDASVHNFEKNAELSAQAA